MTFTFVIWPSQAGHLLHDDDHDDDGHNDDDHQVAHVRAERDILVEADHQWVAKMYYSFQVMIIMIIMIMLIIW